MLKDEIPYDLLLLADPSQEIVNSYLQKGICYLAYSDNTLIGEIVLVPTEPSTMEIMNVAVHEDYQGKGIGKQLIHKALEEAAKLGAATVEIGTGNSSIHQLKLYQQCGFRISGIDHDFFMRNYDEPIFENGIQCKDMIRLTIIL
ncbi:N-acetyltransferase [Paenibacillus albiflavus]|uniref:N-acetyltransferase n=1 Tax=Paenibacillus albiflavus TaxID=2545760 RepID=A0A4R4ENU3_9BACL|nr:GNAT family N-acetyltransferase [Paenibacillus albiflavus]TCZ81283.1 N-acetyltransferase [Paenibacillus albiflavus]